MFTLSVCVDTTGKKKKEGSGGFEAAMAAAEQDVKKVEAMKRFPGLCLPDNPDQAKLLLEPDSKNMRAAKDALSEVRERTNACHSTTSFTCT